MSWEAFQAKRIKTEKIETEEILSDSDEFDEIVSNDKEHIKMNDETISNGTDCAHMSQNLVFLIDWTTRDQLVANLTKLTSLLYVSDEHYKKTQTKASRELVGKLMSLTLKGNPSKQHVSGRLILEIDHTLRNEIIANLISNNDAQQYGQQYKEKAKLSLIAENDKILKALLSLPLYVDKVAKNEVQTETGELIENDLDLCQHSSDRPDDLDKKLSGLRKELKTEMSEMMKTSLNNKPEIRFTFKVSGLKGFFCPDQVRFSETFFVRGFPWYIELVYRGCQDEADARLEAYLHCDYKAPKSTRFAIETKVEFRLISCLNYGKDVVYKFTHSYAKRVGNGTDRLIEHLDLIDSRNGFVEKDTLYLACHLFAEKPVFYRKEDKSETGLLS